MSSNEPQTLLLASNLGSVGNFDPTVPLARVIAKGSLHTGQLFLRATLDELLKIRNLSKSLEENYHGLVRETTAQYDDLMQQKEELESYEKRNWMLKLFKFTSMRRAKRAFISDTFELWESTRTTSDKLKRTILSTATRDLAPVKSESVAENAVLGGLAVDMPDGPVTQEAITIVDEVLSYLASENPFADPSPSENEDGQISAPWAGSEAGVSSPSQSNISASPSSPGSASNFSSLNFSIYYNNNVVQNTSTNTPGFTIINNGSGNSGSVTNPPS